MRGEHVTGRSRARPRAWSTMPTTWCTSNNKVVRLRPAASSSTPSMLYNAPVPACYMCTSAAYTSRQQIRMFPYLLLLLCKLCVRRPTCTRGVGQHRRDGGGFVHKSEPTGMERLSDTFVSVPPPAIALTLLAADCVACAPQRRDGEDCQTRICSLQTAAPKQQ